MRATFAMSATSTGASRSSPHRQVERVLVHDRLDFAEVHLHELAGPQMGPCQPGAFEMALDLAVHPGEAERRVDGRVQAGELDHVTDACLLGRVDEGALGSTTGAGPKIRFVRAQEIGGGRAGPGQTGLSNTNYVTSSRSMICPALRRLMLSFGPWFNAAQLKLIMLRSWL